MRKVLPQLARLQLGKDGRTPEVRLEIGIVEKDGKAYVGIKLGTAQFVATPDHADEISADIRMFAIEARNGGALT